MATYHGVALLDDEGQAIGSLCHFDPAIKFLSDKEFAILHLAGKAISKFLAAERKQLDIGESVSA